MAVTQEHKLKAIIAECAKIHPDIMTLQFGCKINDGTEIFLTDDPTFGNDLMTVYDTESKETGNLTADYIEDESGEQRLETIEDLIANGELEILGRDIQLADVLAMLEGKWDGFVDTMGYFRIEDSDYDSYSVGYEYMLTKVEGLKNKKNLQVSWLLGKPLHLQPTEVIDFLYKIITQKK